MRLWNSSCRSFHNVDFVLKGIWRMRAGQECHLTRSQMISQRHTEQTDTFGTAIGLLKTMIGHQHNASLIFMLGSWACRIGGRVFFYLFFYFILYPLYYTTYNTAHAAPRL